MREHVETALRGVVDRALVVEHRVVDGQGGHRRVVERDVLVGVVRVGGGVGDDVGPRRLRAGARGGRDRDVRRVLGVLALVETLEVVHVASVVGNRDAGALAGVVGGAATDGDEAVAFVLLVELHGVHDVVVLGVGLHLVVDDDLEPVPLQRFGHVVHDVGATQPGGHQQGALEAHLERFGADHLVCAGTHHGAGEGVEFLDREGLEEIFDLHGVVLSGPWRRCSRDESVL